MAVAGRTWPSSRGIVDRRGSLAVSYGGPWVSSQKYGTDFGPAVPCCLFRTKVVKDPGLLSTFSSREQLPQ